MLINKQMRYYLIYKSSKVELFCFFPGKVFNKRTN